MADTMLPYEGTPPPDPTPALTGSSALDETQAGNGSGTGGVVIPTDPLDRPLDDYKPEVPGHVQSLIGRMGRGKVYLLEETPAIIHVDGEQRIRGDPHLARLAEQLDTHDPTAWLAAVSETIHSPIRPNALFVRSDVIKHLSTSKVFSWATSLGAGVMGIEWLNDETLHLLFPTPAAALLALTLLSKAGFDPTEGDDPLLERSAHTVPIHLLPQAELDPKDSQAGTELIAPSSSTIEGDVPKRRGRGNFAGDSADRSDLPSMSSRGGDADAGEWNLAEGVDPNARITIRFAIESDTELRREAKASEWYKRHGRRAGKETTSSPRNFGERDTEPSWEGRGESGEGREFARRLGGRDRRDRGPYARQGNGDRPRGRGRKTADDLDRELEGFARRRDGGEGGEDGTAGNGGEGMDLDEDMNAGGGGRRRRKERKGVEDLDKELDDMFAARATAA